MNQRPNDLQRLPTKTDLQTQSLPEHFHLCVPAPCVFEPTLTSLPHTVANTEQDPDQIEDLMPSDQLATTA
eukprot:CAMPEP_0203782412 /NCGR_PEP_ID=MMETSP0099_2-20121227/11000_1 /ASSEMBLY_ACC=CAM_ASM_000209 /TAXON_ID=96639 /ORGANISM=" , Strain NY0313808BC1" /LENGTH=70 /DNA_ID=CAMNT_0050683953 /DNA_START=75 /DNA_END=284 /DNA_ORIENTATION=-